MSAFIVDPRLIDYLIAFAAKSRSSFYIHLGNERKFSPGPDSDAIGQILVNANRASVRARYGDDAREMLGEEEPYVYRHVWSMPGCVVDPDPTRRPGDLACVVQALKFCDCFDYQACEVSDYRDTDAAKIVDQIRHWAIGALPGYSDAMWDATKPIP